MTNDISGGARNSEKGGLSYNECRKTEIYSANFFERERLDCSKRFLFSTKQIIRINVQRAWLDIFKLLKDNLAQ